MARTESYERHYSPTYAMMTFNRVTSPIVNFCTISTDALDTLVQMCAGGSAIKRIEHARSVKLIRRLSSAPTPEPVRPEVRAAAEEERISRANSLREGRFRRVSPDDKLSGLYPFKLDTSPAPPVLNESPGKGSLYGAIAEIQRRSPSERQVYTRHRKHEYPLDQQGRTNLANQYHRLKPACHLRHSSSSSSQKSFVADPKTSSIAKFMISQRQLSTQHQETTEDDEEWSDETSPQADNKGVKLRKSPLSKEVRVGRRAVKFHLGGKKSVDTTENTGQPEPKEIDQASKTTVNPTINMEQPEEKENNKDEGECAIESDEDDDFSQAMMEQQKRRKSSRYSD